MKTLRLFMVLAVSPLICGNIAGQAAKAVPAEPKISITIKSAQSTAAAGSDIQVEVEMKNISTGDIYYSAAGIFGAGTTSFRWDVRDGASHPVPVTEYGIKANHADPPREGGPPTVRAGSSFAATLAPGKVITQMLALTKEYDLSKPGKYTIQAFREDGQTEVKSNVITITVTP